MMKASIRRLLNSPLYASFTIVTFSLAVGASAAGLAAARSVLMPPATAAEANIVNIYHEDPLQRGNLARKSFRWSEYQAIRGIPVFDAVVAHGRFREPVTFEPGAELVWGEFVTGNYFDAMTVRPAAGRLMQAADDSLTTAPVAVLSYSLWQKIFGGDPLAVGSTVRINSGVFQIVGIAPQTFRGTFAPELFPTGLWVPLAHAPSVDARRQNGAVADVEDAHRWLLIKARLRPGVSVEEARAHVATIAARLDGADPLSPIEGRPPTGVVPNRRWVAIPAADIRLHGRDGFLKSLAAAGLLALGLVVLIACTNIANLTVARMRRRKKEMAIRRSLGASAGRILREQILESLVLSLLSCGLGLWVAYLLMRLMSQEVVIGDGRTFSIDPSFDVFVVVAAVGVATVMFVLFGMAPVLTIVRDNLRDTGGLYSETVSHQWRSRKQLVSLQVGLSVAMLAAAAVCVFAVQQHLRRTNAMDLDRLAVLQVTGPSPTEDLDDITRSVHPATQQLARQAGLEAVAVASGIPGLTDTPAADILTGQTASRGGSVRVRSISVTSNFYTTVGLRILHGRTFGALESQGSQPVAILSRRLADYLFPLENAIGHRIDYRRARLTGENVWPLETPEVIGVVEDTGEEGMGSERAMVLYTPLAHLPQRSLAIIGRTENRTASAAASMFRTFRAASPATAVTFVGTAEQLAASQMALPRFGRALMLFLGIVALLLALVGLYGILSFVVEARKKEIGVRMALGATQEQVTALIVRDGLGPVVVGLALGIVAAVAVWGIAARMLLLTDPNSMRAVVLTLIASSLLTAAFIACRIPARRAARLDPAQTLRHF